MFMCFVFMLVKDEREPERVPKLVIDTTGVYLRILENTQEKACH